MKSIKRFLATNWPVVLILLVAGLVLAYKIDKPFEGHHDWNGSYWGNVSRNYVRYGLIRTKLAMVENVGPVKPKDFAYTFHYSPLYPLASALFLKLFGPYEWSIRLLSLFASIATLAVFYSLVHKLFSKSVAVSVVLLWIATPMFIYFGKLPAHEPLALFFAVTSVYFYLKKGFRRAVLFAILAELTTWPGYFVVPAITFHWWLTSHGRRSNIHWIAFLWIASLLVFSSLLLHDYTVTGSFLGGGLSEIFFFRVQSVSLLPYVTLLFRWALTYYFLLVPLSLIWFVVIFTKRPASWQLTLSFLVFALIYPAIFKDASQRHDYLLIYFLPYLSLSSSQIISLLFKNKSILVAIVIALLTVIFRWNFILALENSDIYKESVRLGKFVNSHSSQKDKVRFNIEDSQVGFDTWFINFYADRAINNNNPDVVVDYLPSGMLKYHRVR